MKPTAALATLAMALSPTFVFAETLEELAAKAASENEIVWYESNPPEMGDKIVADFEEQFPELKLRFERVTGAQGMLSRIVQETEAKAPTADVMTTGIDQAFGLNERKLADTIAWKDYGVPDVLSEQPYAVVTTASTWVIVYNTDKIAEADAPKTWDDLLAPKLKGRQIGLWAIGHPPANLVPAWGEEKVDAYVKSLMEQQPLLFKSAYTITQNVASGELLAGIVPLHVVQTALAAGAPIKVVMAEPIPLSMIYSTPVAGSPNPNGTRLLIAWLTSEKGALAYENAFGRGNPYLPFTETAKRLQGKTVSTFEASKSGELQRMVNKYTEVLRSAGEAL